MLAELQTGPQSVSGSAKTLARAGQQGDLIVSELHGKYYEQVARGKVWGVSSQAAVTTSAALTTTFTGLSIANPAASGVNLVLLRFSVAQFAVGAAAMVGIMSGSGASAGSLIVRNRLTQAVGGSATVASAGSTLGGTPVVEGVYGQVGSLATTGYGLTPGLVVQLDGEIIIPPGSFAASYTTIATTSALGFGFVWEEVPILS